MRAKIGDNFLFYFILCLFFIVFFLSACHLAKPTSTGEAGKGVVVVI